MGRNFDGGAFRRCKVCPIQLRSMHWGSSKNWGQCGGRVEIMNVFEMLCINLIDFYWRFVQLFKLKLDSVHWSILYHRFVMMTAQTIVTKYGHVAWIYLIAVEPQFTLFRSGYRNKLATVKKMWNSSDLVRPAILSPEIDGPRPHLANAFTSE